MSRTRPLPAWREPLETRHLVPALRTHEIPARTARAFDVAQQLRTGNVGINTAQRNHELPFGGFKMSGVGRDGGRFGFHAYSELQSIVWPG